MSKPTKKAAGLLERLRSDNAPPSGWKTFKELHAESPSMGATSARRTLQAGLDSGAIVSEVFTIPQAGKFVKALHYREASEQ